MYSVRYSKSRLFSFICFGTYRGLRGGGGLERAFIMKLYKCKGNIPPVQKGSEVGLCLANTTAIKTMLYTDGLVCCRNTGINIVVT